MLLGYLAHLLRTAASFSNLWIGLRLCLRLRLRLRADLREKRLAWRLMDVST